MARARVEKDRRLAQRAEHEHAERLATDTWGYDDDPWAGMVDEAGFPFEIEPAEAVAAADVAAGAETPRLFNLPEEFWGARELFKTVRQQARADGTAPDAVLGAVLARASAMVPHQMKFDSGKIGTFNMFVNIVAPTGIGKTEAMRSAQRVVTVASYLAAADGAVDFERFRDGVALGSGEGLAEVYMGTKEIDTGEFIKSGPGKGDPKTKPMRAQVRHNAFLFLDEGESLTKMLERKGATVGQTLRTAWTGATLGAANAQETTTRFIPDGQYSMGILIGWQPKAAMALIGDKAGGTPQRFLWLSALDPDMPDDPDERPEPLRLPLCDGHGHEIRGTVHFPVEIKRALRAATVHKNRTGEAGDELQSHEPLMRCKVAALLCVLDGRRMVDQDDWRLAGMVWQVSCAVRDRLVAFGETERRVRVAAELERHAEMAQAAELARVTVTQDVERVARRIWKIAHAADEQFIQIKRTVIRKDKMGRDKPLFDTALAFARSMGWLADDEPEGCLLLGRSRPAE